MNASAAKGMLFALLLGLAGAGCVHPDPARADRPFSGDLGLAAGWTSLEGRTPDLFGFPTATREHPTSAVGFLTLRAQPSGCPATISLRLRHPFYDDPQGFWKSKRELQIEGDLPLPLARTTLFLTYVRTYSGHTSDYSLAGIRRSF